HDDALLNRILIGRCFPVAFGPPVPNVSDPSGLNCVDLPVADLGSTNKTGGNFPTMAIDKAGKLQAVLEQDPLNDHGQAVRHSCAACDWSLWMVQTLNGHAATPTFTAPILASEHFIHRGSMYTLIGGQNGDRTLGDFLQLRMGPNGEAEIGYADSNNIDEAFAPHGMFVR